MSDSANDNQRPEGQDSGGSDRPARCPICDKPADAKYRPFCSKHCADVDLARWLGGRYAIPVRPDEDEDGEPGGGGEAP